MSVSAEECREFVAEALRQARTETLSGLVAHILHAPHDVDQQLAVLPSTLEHLERLGTRMMATDFDALIEIGPWPADNSQEAVNAYLKRRDAITRHINS